MATPSGQGQPQLQPPGQAQQAVAKGDITPVLQQLNMNSLRTRTKDLHTAIGRILHAFHTNPSLKWSEVLDQFAMVNVELLNLVDDIKPILKMFVVYPKNVNAGNAPILPIMLSSKLLPEMEAEEAAMKEHILGGIGNLPIPVQTDKLQRQIEAVRSACDIAEKVITEARKVYGLGTRQGPVSLATLDKVHVTRIAEQEKLLRAATNFGEGLRIPADQQQQPSILPQHLSSALASPGDGRTASYVGADSGYLKTPVPLLPPTGLRAGAQQQASLPARVQTPTQPVGIVGVTGLTSASPSTSPYIVNSPRSGGTNFNVPSPQQAQQQQQQSQAAFLQQRTKVQQQQAQLQRQQQQLQVQLQQQQQQQLRRPATPPIPQAQVGAQPQVPVAQPLLQQQQKQQLQQLQQQQNQNRQSQQYAHQQQAHQILQQQQAQQLQDRQAMHHMQVSQQQQNLHQQLQSSQLQTSQNTVQQGGQVRAQMGQLGSSMTNLYGAGTQTLLTSNMMGAMSQPMQSQSLLQQRMQQFQQGTLNTNQLSANQSQQNVSSQMLPDSLYNMGVTGTGTQLPQNSSNLGLPLQQQLPQSNYMNMFNTATQPNFGQNRQQPPPS